MFNFSKLFFSVLISLLIFRSFAVEKYLKKPDWWDKIDTIKIVKDENPKTSYEKTLEKLGELRGVGDWYILGPFDTENIDNPFSKKFPPEENERKFHRNAVYKGKGGKEIKWLKWDGVSPMPFAPYLRDFVAFFYKKYKAPKNIEKLYHTSDDGVSIYVNDKEVYRFEDGRSMDINNPIPFDLDLKKGEVAEIFIKLHQRSGKYGLIVFESPNEFTRQRIKILSGIIEQKGELKGIPNGFLEDLADYYRMLGDYENSFFCLKKYLKSEKKAKRHRIFYKLRDDYLPNKESHDKILNFCNWVVTGKYIKNTAKGQLLNFMFDLMNEKERADDILKFIGKNKSMMQKNYPCLSSKNKITSYIRLGNYEKASEELKKFRNLKSEDKNRHERDYKHLKGAVNAMRSSVTGISIDWAFDSTKGRFEKIKKTENSRRTARFVRNILSEKADKVIATDNSDLYSSALVFYKKIFGADPGGEYRKQLNFYLNLLKNKLKYSKEKTDIVENRLSLPLKKHSLKSCKDKRRNFSFNFNKGNKIVQDILRMNPGFFEFSGRYNFLTGKIEKCNVYETAVDKKENVFLQNSRELLCIKKNKMLWRYLNNYSIIENKKQSRDDSRYIIGKFKPTVSQKNVFVRFLDKGKFNLFAFRKNNGELLWQSDESFSISSNPVYLSGKIFAVGKEKDTVSNYFFLVFNAENGKLIDKLFLYASNDKTPFRKYARDIYLDMFMRLRLCNDDYAVICTNSGVDIAVSLKSFSVNWIRKYAKLPFASGNEIASKLIAREYNFPIINDRQVLTADIDSVEIQLLDLLSGKNLASFNIDWKQIMPFTENKVALLQKDGSFGIISFEKLQYYKSNLKFDRLVKSFKNTLTAEKNGELFVINSDLKQEKIMRIPEKYTVLNFTEESAIMFSDEKNLNKISLFSDDNKEDKAEIIPEKVGEIVNPYYIKLDDSVYLNTADYLIKLDAKLSADWVLPVLNGDRIRFFKSENCLFVFSEKNVLILNDADGKIIHSLSESSTGSGDLLFPSLKNNVLVFAKNNKLNDEYKIFTADKSGFKKLGKIDTGKGWLKGILNRGKLLLMGSGKKIRFFKMDSKGKYVFSDKTIDIGLERWRYSSFQLSNSAVLIFKDEKSVLIFGDMKSKKVKIRGRTNYFNYNDLNINKQRKFFNNLFLYRMCWKAVNIVVPEDGKDYSYQTEFSMMPLLINKKILAGISSNPHHTIKLFDLEKRKIIFRKNIHEKLKKITRPITGAYPRFSFAFKMKNKIYFFFKNDRHKDFNNQNVIACLDLKTKKIDYDYFPGFNNAVAAVPSEKYILFVTENSFIRITKKTFFELMKKNPNLYAFKKNNNKITVDGFPDEWKNSEFRKLNNNRFAFRFNNNSFSFIAEIRNPEMIRYIGEKGLDERFELIVLPGPAAGFEISSHYEDEKYLFRKNLDSNYSPDKWKYSFSMAPDGKNCFFEAEIPCSAVSRIEINRLKKEEKIKKRCGRIALDILTDKGLGIFSNGEFPWQFPAAYEHEENKDE